MRPIPLLSASIFALAASLAFAQGTPQRAQPSARAPAAAQVPSALPRNVRPLHYRIAATPDAGNLTFRGRTDVDIQVIEATESITLNAVDMRFGEVSLGGTGAAPLAISPRDIRVDEEAQTATFRFPRAIAPGRYRLTMT